MYISHLILALPNAVSLHFFNFLTINSLLFSVQLPVPFESTMKPLQPKAGTSSLKRRQNVNSTKKKASGKMKKASHSRLERIIEAKEVGWVKYVVD